MNGSRIIYKDFRINGLKLDDSSIFSLEIIESLEFPGLYGSLILQDFDNIKEVVQPAAGDLIEIIFVREDDEANYILSEFNINVIISESTELFIKNESKTVQEFKFVSPWMFETTNKTFTKWSASEKTFTNLVEELFESINAPFNLEYLQDSFWKQGRLVTPKWNLQMIFNYVIKNAIDEDNFSGFKIFYDRINDSMRFQNVRSLLDESLGMSIGEIQTPLQKATFYDEHPSNILKLNLISNGDANDLMAKGIPKTRGYQFRYDYGDLYSTDDDIIKKFEDYQFLSQTLPLNWNTLSDYFTKQIYTFDNSNFDNFLEDGERNPLEESKNPIKTKIMRRYQYIDSTVELLVLVPGITDTRSVGMIQPVNYPSPKFENKQQIDLLSGNYLISRINHIILGRTYQQKMKLISDGINPISRTDLIDYYSDTDSIIDLNFLDDKDFNEFIYY